jgi:hypothetical protein
LLQSGSILSEFLQRSQEHGLLLFELLDVCLLASIRLLHHNIHIIVSITTTTVCVDF